MFGNVLTEKIEELLLAWMHPVLEHRSFSLDVRIRVLKENLGFVIAYQPRAAVRGFYDKNLRETTQRTSNRLLEHLPHHRMISVDDGSSISYAVYTYTSLAVYTRPAATRAFFAPLCGIRSKSFRNKYFLKMEV